MKSPEPCNIKDYTLCILGVGIVIGFFFVNYLVLVDKISPDNDTNVTTILNYTNSLVIFVAGFFFGASKTNTDKDKAIADMASASAGTGNGTTTTATVEADKTTVKTEPTKTSGEVPVEPLQADPKV